MSWNSSIQFAKLYKAFLTLSTTALTNPMVANLNMATYSITNVNTISAVSGNTLSLSADASQGITVNTKLLIPNHPLVITNNTVNDSLQVYDTTPDTTIFRVDHNGNVAVKADPSTTLTDAFTVNGQSTFVGGITCSGISSGFGTFSSLTAPTRSSGDNTTNVATTAFVESAITSTSVRNSIPLNVNYTGSLVINNDAPFTPVNIASIVLPSAFNGCNVFTIYFRNLYVISTSTSTVGAVSFWIYPSKTSTSGFLNDEGALSFRTFSTNSGTTVNDDIGVILNWRPLTPLVSNTIYFNLQSVSTTSPVSTTTLSDVQFEYDIVGTKATLVSVP
jgi:hypothetical protein